MTNTRFTVRLPVAVHAESLRKTAKDELVTMRVKGKGDLYIHQDANWNVIGATDLAGNLVERYVLTPYGELTVDQSTDFGDRDGNGKVDSVDKGTVGTTCTGTISGVCRVLDLDFDGDYDSNDATAFDLLPQGLAIHPGRTFTAVDQPFGHQGLVFDAEVGSYQNPARQYDPGKRRFVQRDPLVPTSTAGSGFQDGVNLYASSRMNPFLHVDPSGLTCTVGTYRRGLTWQVSCGLWSCGTKECTTCEVCADGVSWTQYAAFCSASSYGIPAVGSCPPPPPPRTPHPSVDRPASWIVLISSCVNKCPGSQEESVRKHAVTRARNARKHD